MVNKKDKVSLELTLYCGGGGSHRHIDNQHIKKKFQRVVSAKNKTNQSKVDRSCCGWEE